MIGFVDVLCGAGLFTEDFPPGPYEEGKDYMYQNAWYMVSPESYNWK